MSKAETQSGGERLEVVDPEDYLDQRRRKEICDAKEEVREVHKELKWKAADPSVSVPYNRLLLAFRAAVEDFLVAIEPITVASEAVNVEEFWHNRRLGEVVIHPPSGFTVPPVRREVTGLNQILNLPDTIRHQFTDQIQSRHGGLTTRSTVVEQPLPEHVLQRAAREGAKFLTVNGWGLEFDGRNEEGELEFDSVFA